MKFLNEKEQEEIFGQITNNSIELNGNGNGHAQEKPQKIATTISIEETTHHSSNTDAPLCDKCGTIMFRAGSCYSCPNCFNTTGVCN
jgi:tRNA(Ile2) C34 agmatinyltransferase TiaS